jgi:hypothetical protein
MDLEAAVIRAEMSQTRNALDLKLTRLEERAREMTPRRYWARHKPDFLLDRTIGGALALAGLALAWKQYRRTPGPLRPTRPTAYAEGPV